MRTTSLVGLALAIASFPSSRAARADGFAELAGGLALPASNSNWTNAVDPSLKLQGRVGELANDSDFGGMLAADWTPASLKNSGGSFGVGSTNASLQRFRILASAVVRHRIAPKLTLTGRAGAGIDIVHASVDLTVLGNTTSASDSDVGYAFDFGLGVWYDVGSTTQVGFELGMPIGHHDHQASQSGQITFNYTSIDLDFLVGVHF